MRQFDGFFRAGGLAVALRVAAVVSLSACGSGNEGTSVLSTRFAPAAASVDPGTSHLNTIKARVLQNDLAPPSFNYAEALQKSLYFYEAQQSGKLPAWNRVKWRGDSRLNDGADVGRDLSGGWYDAGDQVKFGFPMAASATQLAWGALRFGAGFDSAGQRQALLNNLRFVNDYFIKAHTAPNELYVQVGDGNIDHSWWGPAEVFPLAAPSFKIGPGCPGSDVAAETAAAMASASMLFKASDAAYAARLLTHARQLYDFADTVRGRYSDCVPQAAPFYTSPVSYQDALAWGAVWMWRATGEAAYLQKAETAAQAFSAENGGGQPYNWTQGWGDKIYGVYLLLAEATGKQTYIDAIERNLDFWTSGLPDGQRVAYTPGGLAWLTDWGSLRYAMGASFLALAYADVAKDPARGQRYRAFARRQLDYVLGANPRGASYVVGFGNGAPQHPHHKGAQGSWSNQPFQPATHRHVIYGAMVGGPALNDSFTDRVEDYVTNEVGVDYNAAFTGVLAGVNQMAPGSQPLAVFPPDEPVPEDEIFAEATVILSDASSTVVQAFMNNRSGWPARHGDKLSMRYFVDLSEVLSAGLPLSTVNMQLWYSEGGALGALQRCGASNVFAVPIDFTGTDIYPGGTLAARHEVQFRIGVSAGAWNPDNDPSYANLSRGAAVKTTGIAVYDAGKKIFGNEPAVCGGAATPLPVAPGNLQATGGGGSIALAWNAVPGASGYVLRRSPTGAAGSFQPIARPLGISFTDSNLTADSTYFYSVAARNATGEGPTGAVVSARTAVGVPVAATPNVVAGNATATITWPNVPGATGYDIARAESSTGPWLVRASNQRASRYTDAPLVNGRAYWWQVTARNVAGMAPASAAVSATPRAPGPVVPPPPAAVTVTALAGDGQANLSWPVATGATGQSVQRALAASGPFTVLASLVGNVAAYVDTTAINGTTYWYRVAAINAGGATPSAAVSVTPIAAGGIPTRDTTASCSLLFNATSDWGFGQVLQMRLTNTGSQPITNWRITWTASADMSVTNSWNATIASNGRSLTATPAAWNVSIPPGGSIEPGMQIAYGGARPLPMGAALAGQNCTVTVTQ